MRPLFPGLLAAFAAGIWLADCGWFPLAAALQLAVFLLLAAVGILRRPAERVALAHGIALAAGVVCLGVRLGSTTVPGWAPFDATLQAEVCRSDKGWEWVAVELCRVAFLDAARPGSVSRVRVVANGAGPERAWLAGLTLGEIVRLRAQIEPLRERRNPGSRSARRAQERRGVGATARLSDPRLTVRIRREPARVVPGIARSIGSLRESISVRLRAAGPGGSLLAALGVGDRSGISPGVRESFRQLGIGHLLAISGLHLGLAAGLGFALTWRVLCRFPRLPGAGDMRRPAIIVALGLAFGYALLAGWGVPVRRALVLVSALGAGFLVQRTAAGFNVLAAAGLGILVFDPGCLFEPAAQLSFAASAGLMVAARQVAEGSVEAVPRTGLRRLGIQILDLLSVSAAAVAATAPLVALHGWVSSPFGLLANLILVPLTSFLLLPLALVSALVAACPVTALGGWFLGLAAWVGSATINGVASVAAWLPALAPGRPPSVGVWVLACGLAGVALTRRRTWMRVCVSGGTVLLLSWGPKAEPPPVAPRLVAFEVGQGDAVLVQGESAAVLVDGGWGAGPWTGLGHSAVVPALVALGVDGLDVVVATHADTDHRGGLDAVLRRIGVRELWLPPGGGADPGFANLVEEALRRGTSVFERAAGDGTFQRGDLLLTPIWPRRNESVESRNEGSLVVRIERQAFSILLTGDIGVQSEAELLDSGVDLRAHVLKVAHHGSRGSSGSRFLDAVDPAIAIVSAGCHSRRGLPNFEVLQRLRSAGAAVWWTGRDGAVVVSLASPLLAWSWDPLRIRSECGDPR